MLDIDAIEARAAAATPGEWTASLYEDQPRSGVRVWYVIDAEQTGVVQPDSFTRTSRGESEEHCGVRIKREDAEFIAASRSDVPALVAAVRSTTEVIGRLVKALESWGAEGDGVPEDGPVAAAYEEGKAWVAAVVGQFES